MYATNHRNNCRKFTQLMLEGVKLLLFLCVVIAESILAVGLIALTALLVVTKISAIMFLTATRK